LAGNLDCAIVRATKARADVDSTYIR